ncbi:uncharacterized protein LOC111802587 [Cucurbita pepo subsp. pepo]|uniref:uncharacterized protein LOC111802587 n=1 Tax=Cucurbita pepo subsp. pepo TaxID=3664 RepID=UPI000C9DA3DB|nr:uncharacterized protein LOC111802587 [Cucurbita pepo subsp. pepo]
MFGRIRSPSSLDSLERPTSKIHKDDCLSIYETTLMKLKLGSQRDPCPPITLEDGETDSNSSSSCTEAMNTHAFLKDSHQLVNSTKQDLMAVDSDYSTTSTPDSSEDCQSTEYSTQRRMNNSILYLFSKFKNSSGTPKIMEEAVATEDICCVVMSPSSSASQLTDNSELHSEQEPIDFSTALSEKVP